MANKNRGNRKGRQANKQTIPDDIRRGTSYQTRNPSKDEDVSEASVADIRQSQTEVVVDDPPQMTKVDDDQASNDEAVSNQTNDEGDTNVSEENKTPEANQASLVLFRTKQNGDRVQRAEVTVPVEVGSHPLIRMPTTDKENDSATLSCGVRFVITEEDMDSGDAITSAIERFNRKYRNNPVVGRYHVEINVDADKAA
tara:strand:- start:50066 stop:50659 length:594 start_codon:yes stop_codon:yes gene_type:complete